MSTSDRHLSRWAPLRACVATVLGLLLLAMGGPARADWYQYTFMSDVFNIHSRADRAPGVNEWDLPGQLRIEFYSWELLSGSATEDNIISYKMTIWGGGDSANGTTLSTPLPPSGSIPPAGEFEYDGSFSVSSFDAAGLPDVWNIWLTSGFWGLGVSETISLASSNTGSSLERIAYSYYSAIGSVTAGPNDIGGVWTVALVPEPETQALLLAGLLLIAGVVQRQRRI